MFMEDANSDAGISGPRRWLERGSCNKGSWKTLGSNENRWGGISVGSFGERLVEDGTFAVVGEECVRQCFRRSCARLKERSQCYKHLNVTVSRYIDYNICTL